MNSSPKTIDVALEPGVANFLVKDQQEVTAMQTILQVKRNTVTSLIGALVAAAGKGALEQYANADLADTEGGKVIRLTLREEPQRPEPAAPVADAAPESQRPAPHNESASE